MGNLIDNIKNKFKNDESASHETSQGEQSKVQKSEAYPSSFDFARDRATASSVKNSLLSGMLSLIGKGHDLAYVASIVDDAIVIPIPFKHKSAEEKLRPVSFEEDKAFAEEHFKVNIRLGQKVVPYVESRKALYSKIRTVYPEFGTDMEHKVSPEDYAIYSKQAKALRAAISDTPIDRSVSLKENLLMTQDRYSEIIDTRDFARACEIEDKFMIAELKEFLSRLGKQPSSIAIDLNKDDIPIYRQLPGSHNLRKEMISTVHFANQCIDNRTSRLKKYNEINLLYKKLDNHPEVRFVLKDEYEEEK